VETFRLECTFEIDNICTCCVLQRLFHSFHSPNTCISRVLFLWCFGEKNPWKKKRNRMNEKEKLSSFIFIFCYFASFTSDSTEMNTWRRCFTNITWETFKDFGHSRAIWVILNVKMLLKTIIQKEVELLNVFEPLIVMPTSLHFWNRQYWHWVRVDLTITQSWFRIHLYLASSPFMLLKKNF